LGAANRGRHTDAKVDALVQKALATVDADAEESCLLKQQKRQLEKTMA